MSSVLYSRIPDLIDMVRDVALSPFLSGPLLVATTYFPDAARDALIQAASHLPSSLSTSAIASASTLNLACAAKILRVVFAISIVRQLNKILNTMAANSWRLGKSPGWDDWSREVAVVTGGSSGIGRSVTEKLAAMGVRVAVLDVQEMPKAMAQLHGGNRVRFYHCDVTTSESVATAADAVRRDFGHPSILVNNAGITQPTPILKLPESFLRRIFGVNCMSLWLTTQQFLPHMIEVNKGHVVTVGSISSYVALPTGADYSASKAAALAFHEALGCELKHCYNAPNVITTAILPNFVRTPLLKDFSADLERTGVRLLSGDQVADKLVQQVKAKRGRIVVVPESATLIAGIRGWPTWLQEVLRDILGRQSVEVQKTLEKARARK